MSRSARLEGMTNFAWWHFLIVIPMIAIAVLWFLAIWSIAKADVSGTEQAVWILIVIVAPLLGALLWFAIGKNRKPDYGRSPRL